ncbi:hypothetical protein MTP99_009728 [Tenebrio molitor]|nr:hypothetical protein MTP99_009728 [Tenebrio molitor]
MPFSRYGAASHRLNSAGPGNVLINSWRSVRLPAIILRRFLHKSTNSGRPAGVMMEERAVDHQFATVTLQSITRSGESPGWRRESTMRHD